MVETIVKDSKIVELETKIRFEQSLRELTNKIHSSNIDEILISIKEDIEHLILGERVTIYAKDAIRNEIFSRIKDGTEIKEFRVPVGVRSLAGFIAHSKKSIRIKDAYDSKELSAINKDLSFDSSWDKKTGFRTKQVLGVPVLMNDKLYGVVQVINRKDGKPFEPQHETILSELAKTMAIAFQNQQKLNLRTSKYDHLLTNELINQEVLDQAQAQALKQAVSVESILMSQFKVTKADILKSLQEFYKTDFVSFSPDYPIPAELLQKVTIDYLKYHVAVPLSKEGSRVVMLMENPKNILIRDAIQHSLGVSTLVLKVSIKEDILQFIDYFYGVSAGSKEQEAGASSENIGDIIGQIEQEEGTATKEAKVEEEEAKEDDSGIVKLVNQIIEQSFYKNASDIHIEPYMEDDTVIRIRVDGVCVEYAKVPRKFARALVSRLKIMSNLDIAERRLPQDGKIKFKNFGKLDIELRVATIPTQGGLEDVVMRILASSKPIPIEKLGMDPQNLEGFKKLSQEPYGMFLCVGPTGSGKTTTLHSALGYINTPDLKIWTAEDPVEITQKGLRQVQVSAKIGFTFERALRAFLRADPDVVMIGEMRDAETAEAAVEASLTGHIVFSTLHTNSAPETITRLLDLGLDPFAFGDSLLGILAQRLTRKLCECKESYKPDAEELAFLKKEYGYDDVFEKFISQFKEITLNKVKGCDKCTNTGYKGRIGLHELMILDDDIKLMVYRKAKSAEIRELAVKRGMIMLKQDGIRKVFKGQTDFKEVRSCCMK